MCFFCFFLKPHSHLFFALRIQQIEKQRKKEEQRTDSKNREKTERIHKQGEKNRQDTYLRVVEWRTADVVQSDRQTDRGATNSERAGRSNGQRASKEPSREEGRRREEKEWSSATLKMEQTGSNEQHEEGKQ